MSVDLSRCESKRRWPGAPPVCLKLNLPAFEAEADVAKFIEANSPHYNVTKRFTCSCGGWHFEAALAGDDARLGGAPLGFVPFKRQMVSSRFSQEPELPKRVLEAPEVEKEVKLPRAPKGGDGKQKSFL